MGRVRWMPAVRGGRLGGWRAAVLGVALCLSAVANARAQAPAVSVPAMAGYKRMLFSVISARVNQVYARSGLSGAARAVLVLMLDPSGRVTHVAFAGASAPPVANAMALAAVPRAFPPPPLPRGAPWLRVIVPLRFRPR